MRDRVRILIVAAGAGVAGLALAVGALVANGMTGKHGGTASVLVVGATVLVFAVAAGCTPLFTHDAGGRRASAPPRLPSPCRSDPVPRRSTGTDQRNAPR
jgi:hypothetical protein